jgi:fatty-acyl-CoA synthase
MPTETEHVRGERSPSLPGSHPPIREMCLFPHQWLAYWSTRQPDKTALLFGTASYSYRALWERAASLAEGLRRFGIRKGDRVVLLSMNHPCCIELYFACSLAGAIFVPINFRLADREVLFQIEDSDPSAVVFGHGQTDRIPSLRPLVSLPEEAVFALGETGGGSRPLEALFSAGTAGTDLGPFPHLGPEDPQMIMYTSGTTGIPKGALLPYRKSLYNNLNAEVFFELTPRDTVLVPVPLFHSLGLNILTLPVLFSGGTVVLMERFDERALLESIQAHNVTFMGAVPTIYKRLLDFGLEAYDLSSLRFCFTAGAPIPLSLIEQYHEKGILMKQGFGQTETSILCCLEARDAIRKAGSVGTPVRHAEVRLVDENYRDVLPGQVGEIVARGPIVMLGYWRRPEETARGLAGGWLHTQDLAMRDEEGFITLVGRKGDMYISGGENIYPEEVERVYEGHPGIEEVAVLGVPDPDLGEAGAACIVPREGARLDAQGLREYARGKIAGYKIPRHFRCFDALPKTVTGKIQKYLLREMLLKEGSLRGPS